MSRPLRVVFLGSGVVARVHSRHLKAPLSQDFTRAYASRDVRKAQEFDDGYPAALEDPAVHAVVVAVPPRRRFDPTCQALQAGEHVLDEKPAFTTTDDYLRAIAARTRAGRVVRVGEYDHYKPLAVHLRRLLPDEAIGELVFTSFVKVAHRLKAANHRARYRDFVHAIHRGRTPEMSLERARDDQRLMDQVYSTLS